MAYIDTRNDELRKLHSIYSHDISDFICKTVDNKLFNRIRDISKNKGVEISGFNVFPFKYSRLDHSFGVAIILERFKQSKGHVLEALIHELSKPSFSYSYEYLLSYFKIKDYVQPQLDKNIVNDSISADEIKAYSEYNGDYFLGFADFPYLSADNLEFILSNGYLTGLLDIKEIEDIYNNVSILLNEEGNEEFGFTDIRIAESFFKLSIEIGKRNRSYEAKITKRLIADVLMLMMRREEISIDDLFIHSDIELIELGMSSSDVRIREGWEEIANLNKVFTKFSPTNDPKKYCVKVEEPSIYIDPLVKTKAGTFRLSSINNNIEHDIVTYLETDTDMYMYIDYEL